MGICGIDEAGRGPLAGPVVAAAVILPRKGRPKGLDDSKQLTAEAREELARKVRSIGLVGVGVASVEEIDRFNILRASHLAMRRAYEELCALTAPVAALVDGNMDPGLPCPVECIADHLSGLHHRQGRTRPHDGGAVRGISRLRLLQA
jgi:ribonuclease HII